MRQLESLKPDIILTDICMPDIDGLTFAEKIKGRNPDTKVIAITGYDNFEYREKGNLHRVGRLYFKADR